MAKAINGEIITKSGLMVGLGETKDEVKSVLKDLLNSGCDAVTIGQYLRPSSKNLEVQEYISLEVFKEYEEYGKDIGLKHVYSGPFVRSSYNAELLTAS
ncbi:MAG TPA: lipoyl synthase, partial [Deltaproteobacteria bacterium]|nr:lipoyl synthase [Deltaproteobacteria bacterium]